MRWAGEPEDWDEPTNPPGLTVEVTDPEIIGYLYGPRGQLLGTVLDRAPMPFGFVKAYHPSPCVEQSSPWPLPP